MLNTRDILNFVTFGLSLVLMPFMITWYLSFYYLRSLDEIYRRRLATSLLIGFLCMCGTLLSHNLQLLFLNITSIKYIPYSNLLVFIIIYHTTSGVYHLLTYRSWMVYYDIKWNKAMEDSKWRLFIDPNESNWYLRNKTKWGSSKRMFTIIFCNWLFFGICGSVSIIAGGPNTPANKLSKMSIGVPGFIIIPIDAILYFKMPSFNDIYSIHDETKLLLKFKIAFLTSFFIITLVINAQVYTSKYVLLASSGILSSFGITFIMFYYVLKKLNLPTNPYYAAAYTSSKCMEWDISQSGNMKTLSQSKQISFEDVKNIKLKHILQEKHGFNCFARHLTKEFCLENLLFFVETQEWIHLLQEKDTENNIVFKRGFDKIVFPDNAPKSMIIEKAKKDSTIKIINKIENDNNNALGVLDAVIVFDDKGNIVQQHSHSSINREKCPTELKEKNNTDFATIFEYLQCIRLFKKYIPNDSYFCINIDSSSRKNAFAKFGYNQSNEYDIINNLKNNEINKEKLAHIFDESREQIYALLNYAFARFKRTEEFQILSQNLLSSQK